MTKYIIGDIHDVIKTIDKNSIDLIYTNPPYATTNKEWDKPIDWENLWKDMDRVLKPNGIVILHSTQRFTIELGATQLKHFK